MRTTLTIDDSTDKRLRQLAMKTGKTYKEVVNMTLRRGLATVPFVRKAKAYRLKPASMGVVRAGYSLDKALQLAGELENAEIIRRQRLSEVPGH